MREDIAQTIKRTKNRQTVLVLEGLAVGILAGSVALAYRLSLVMAERYLDHILEFVRGSWMKMAGWMLCLVILAWLVGKLIQWEPYISGSGIPQLEGEMTGKLQQRWWSVLAAKFVGGWMALLAGLSLGREGPSIQLGAMAGKGISKALECGKTEEKFLLTCGASAGLAAAFHAPLAGVMFSLEEVHKNFSVSVLVSVMTASITADYIASNLVGLDPVFDFDIGNVLPQEYYGLIIVLGIGMGVMGALYNKGLLGVQSLYKKSGLSVTGKLLIPFLLSGILGFWMPALLGSGHNLIERLTSGEYTQGIILFLFVAKFLFSAICFGSGAPGGIFFPLLVLGALLGGAFGTAGVNWFGMDPDYINNFILLAMAGYFTAIVRAPLTGIILIFEMTGSLSQMLSLTVVCIVAYVVANLLGSKPIYESLLERLLMGNQGQQLSVGRKVLCEFVIMHGCEAQDKEVRHIAWPANCLLVAIQRDGHEIIPKGGTRLHASDTIVVMTDEADEGEVYDKMAEICQE